MRNFVIRAMLVVTLVAVFAVMYSMNSEKSEIMYEDDRFIVINHQRG